MGRVGENCPYFLLENCANFCYTLLNRRLWLCLVKKSYSHFFFLSFSSGAADSGASQVPEYLQK